MRWRSPLYSLNLMGVCLVSMAAFALPNAAIGETAPLGGITEVEVDAAQQAWCDGLVSIGKVFARGGDYRAVAGQVVDDLYDYKDGKVFFKPTLASGEYAFRPTREGAISYFIGGNDDFPNDAGFALKKWVRVTYDNNAAENGIQIHGEVAITMGHVFLTSADGEEVKVEKTFAFRRCQDGKLRLCVHKSALPFDPGE